MLIGKILLEKIEFERSNFVDSKGYEPNILYCPSILENYKGCMFFGMEIKVLRYLSDDSFIMCNSKDLIDFKEILNRTTNPR